MNYTELQEKHIKLQNDMIESLNEIVSLISENKSLKRKIKALENQTNTYKCSGCGMLYKRKSSLSWIRSYCEKSDRFTRLIIQL